MIQNVAFEKMINLDAKVGMYAIEMIDLKAEIEFSAKKIMVGLVFKIDSNCKYKKMLLIE